VDDNDAADFAGAGRLLRFDYANDYFTGTDRYYTQGIGLQYFDPVLRRAPLMPLLPSLRGSERSYGLRLRNSGFTPSQLTSDAPLIGDRPFAATLTLAHVLQSADPERGLTLTATLDAGVIGQAAGGKWQQVGIHRATGNQIPRGWDNQIRNDAVLDYGLRLEKTLASSSRAELGAYAEASLGTLYTNAAAGVSGRAGALDRKGRRFYLFGRAEEKLVGYDATLQGGLLNRGSPYVLTSEQVRRGVARGDVGFAADFGRWAVEADRAYLSREFTSGLSHEWVEISLMRRF
jgi:lipid A 3-O-deacylase